MKAKGDHVNAMNKELGEERAKLEMQAVEMNGLRD